MPITQLQKDVSRSLRQYAKTIDAKVHIRAMPGKGRYVEIHISSVSRPTPEDRHAYYYPAEFKFEDRVRALKTIYGKDCEFAERGCAGNIHEHMMTMNESEWVQFFAGTLYAVQTTEASHAQSNS